DVVRAVGDPGLAAGRPVGRDEEHLVVGLTRGGEHDPAARAVPGRTGQVDVAAAFGDQRPDRTGLEIEDRQVRRLPVVAVAKGGEEDGGPVRRPGGVLQTAREGYVDPAGLAGAAFARTSLISRA